MQKLKLLSALRELVGSSELELALQDGQTVRDLIHEIHEINPALSEKILAPNGELTGLVQVLVQGRNIVWLQGLDTPIRENDTIVLLPPSAGG